MRRRFLLWDHDGVLVDTERWYFEASRAALAPLGVDLTAPVYLEFMAGGRAVWDLARERGTPEETVRARRAERDALCQTYLRTQPIEIPGVADVTRRAPAEVPHGDRHDRSSLRLRAHPRRAGPGSGSSSSCSRSRTIRAPSRTQIPYRAALERFGAPPERGLAGDAWRGVWLRPMPPESTA